MRTALCGAIFGQCQGSWDPGAQKNYERVLGDELTFTRSFLLKLGIFGYWDSHITVPLGEIQLDFNLLASAAWIEAL